MLDPNLNVVDAVSRLSPASSSVSITTSPINGGCASQTFNLNAMGVNYETIGNSTGVNNSFARKVDGDCGWVKTTAISAHAPNKTGGSASVTYDFTAVSTSQCNNTDGSISIQVNSSDVNTLFPMNYTLGYDVDGNGIFDLNDQYVYAVDNSAPSIDINNLAYGHYRITVATASSCNLKSFDFFVFNCYTIILPLRLLYFDYVGELNGARTFKLVVDNAVAVDKIVLEGKSAGDFIPITTLSGPFNKNEIVIRAAISSCNIYRLKLANYAGVVSYSNQIKIYSQENPVATWPNPVNDKILIKLTTMDKGKLSYTIVNANGIAVKTGDMEVKQGEHTLVIPLLNFDNGIYYLRMNGQPLQHALFFRFIK